MTEVVVSKLKIREGGGEQIVWLKEKSGSRMLSLSIGVAEINAIKLILNNVALPRPLTHDLLVEIMHALGGGVQRVVVDRVEKNIFFSKIILRKENGEEIVIDARPSDSIAVALKKKVPIFVDDSVWRNASTSMATKKKES